MAAFNPGVYLGVLRVRQAYPFDVGCLLMRIFPSMASIGTMTMLTLSGRSFLAAGLVASVIALSTFLVSPRVSKLVDEHGQSRVVPFATLCSLAGLAAMIALVLSNGPEWALLLAAVPMGCTPNPQAMARARWTYLIKTGALGERRPELRTMFSYEGILDDVGFMFSPSVSIALASTVAPTAGMAFGGAALAAGTALLVASRSTEPTPGWDTAHARLDLRKARARDGRRAGAADAARQDASPNPAAASENRSQNARSSVFRTSPTVRVLFFIMLFEGAFYGVVYTAVTSFVEELGQPAVASVVLMAASVISMTMGFVFGMVKTSKPAYVQLTACSVAFGMGHASLALASSVPTLFATFGLAALTYAPFLITVNATCERAVPGDRLTEAITWANAGSTCGMAFGPTAGGAIVDALGASHSFLFAAVLAIAVPATVLLCRRALKRDLAAGKTQG